MNFLPRTFKGIALGSLGLSLLLTGATNVSAAETQWRTPAQATTSQLAPPQNDRITRHTAKVATAAPKAKKTTTTAKSASKKAAKAPARVAKSPAAKPTKKLAATKKPNAVQGAAAYTPTTRQMAPWQHTKNASFGLPGGGVLRTAQRPRRFQSASTDGEVILEPEHAEQLGEVFNSGSCSSCGDGFCGGCGDTCGDGCGSCGWDTSCCLPFALPELDNMTVFGGVEGFKGPADLGENGNFGFGIGFNFAGPLRRCDNIGYQIGARYVGSNFNGDQLGGNFEDDTRSQTFITGGIFRRASSCCPWQWGVVYDYMKDEYHYEGDFAQVRIELSRMGCWGNELGVLVMQKAKERESFDSRGFGTIASIDLEVQNQFLFFIRRRFDACGEGRLWGGVSGHGDGIVGGDLRMPLTNSLAVESGFNYLFSKEDNVLAQEGDSYGIGINLVWHPRCKARDAGSNPLRPLFNVANNMTMMLRRP